MGQIQTSSRSEFSIHPDTSIASVALSVSDLASQKAFYQDVLGFHLHWTEGNQAGLGTETRELLRLIEQPGNKRYDRVTGLYHFAILFPNRRELAIAMSRLFDLNYRNYPTDHILTKTTYLDAPEGNGIELYTESPEDGEWFMDGESFFARRVDGSPSNGREPLDVEELFRHLEEDDTPEKPISLDTRIGHVHLHVHDIDEAIDFYHGVLGFDVMGKARAMRAAFVSAGGYHHHIGLNTWQGEGAPPPPPDALGLSFFSVELPTQAALEEVQKRIDTSRVSSTLLEDGLLLKDPSRNGILLTRRSN